MKDRYSVNISFYRDRFQEQNNICEPLKTLKEAQQFKNIIDDTVKNACIVDNVTGKVVEWWKRNK